MRIAVAQMRGGSGDLEGTVGRMLAFAERAAADGAGLVVFPANILTGPVPVAAGDRAGLLADLAEAAARLARELKVPALVPVHLPLQDDPVLEGVLFKDGGIAPLKLMSGLAAYAKASSGARANDDPDELPVLAIGGLNLGLAFTYEELGAFVDYDYDVDGVLFVSTYGFATDDPSSALGCGFSESVFPGDADAMGAWIVGVGSLGCADREVFAGSSFAVAPWGELAAQAPAFEEALMAFDIEKGAEGPLKNPLQPQVYDPAVITWQAVAEGVRFLVEAEGAEGVAVVLDGRLHSALAAAVAVDALGPTKVHPTVLVQGELPLDAASREVARNLRLDASELEAASLGAGGDAGLALDLAYARVGHAARTEGLLLLGMADKTALALGTAPARDLACLLPFADLYRSDVLALSRMRNTISPVVPRAARSRFPEEEVPGLERFGSSAEARLDALDYVVSSFVEWERSQTEIAGESGDEAFVGEVLSRVRSSLAKLPARLLAPIVTSKALEEAAGPIGYAWSDRVRKDDGSAMSRKLAELLSNDSAPGSVGQAEEDAEGIASFVREFAAGVASLGSKGPSGGPDSQGGKKGPAAGRLPDDFWDGPFSEN